MGIRGLWSRVLKDYQHSLYNFIEVIEFGATLLIDGNAFLFHLLDRQLPTLYKRYSFPREYGGCYGLITEVVRLEIQRLRQELGFSKLIFYFDGPDSYFKQDTREKRQKQILEQWDSFYELSMGLEKATEVKPQQLPLPLLSHQVMRQVLREMKITTISCPGEADQVIAIDCQKMNESRSDGKTIAFCYSGDSDFLIMKDCPLIAIGSLDDKSSLTLHLKEAHQSSLPSSKLSIALVVWRRKYLAQLYDCSEELLIKWAILMGNDFTGCFESSLFHPQLSDEEYLPPSELLAWLKAREIEEEEQKEEFNNNSEADRNDSVSSDVFPFIISNIRHDEVRLACQYSYLFYELEDVTPLCTEETRTISSQADESFVSPEIEDGILLQPQHRRQIQDWLVSMLRSDSGGKVMIAQETLASLTVKFLKDCIILPSKQTNNTTTDSVSSAPLLKVIGTTDLSSIFSAEHVEGIVAMINQLLQMSMDPLKFSLSLLSKSNQILLRWENVLAGNFFQLLVKEIHRTYTNLTTSKAGKEQGMEEQESVLVFQPNLLYDGILFHFLLQQQAFKGTTAESATNEERHLAKGTVEKATNENHNYKKEELLPIDQYRDEILARIDRSRVVILCGETGCGKSTRVPIFIYEEAQRRKKKCRIIICQPRRIACVNLKTRLQEKFGDKVGLRMGHGVKEETSNTQIFFVTSGYLVRLLAHRPQSLDFITHLIIDEVHERSVENDLLCYLIKRKLASFTQLHLILMSATVQTTLYQDYFNEATESQDDIIVEDAISVGVRRFPVDIVYVEGIGKAVSGDKRVMKCCEFVVESCQRTLNLMNKTETIGGAVPLNLAKAQYDLCASLIHKVGKFGCGVLIFVSGMSDILELQSRFETGPGSGVYKVIGIHSEIPFEDQLEALQPPGPEEIKVIIATNAAESSVTLPNVDVVICLGTHKAVNVQPSKGGSKKKDIERSMLTNVWISKSSAIQRAGRTGRLRPGKVFRLYSQELYEKGFLDHDSAEIHRKPLYEVVITLKSIFDDDPTSATQTQTHSQRNGKSQTANQKNSLLPAITTMRDILENLIEKVSGETIDNALSFLYYQHMLSSPHDTTDSRLTSLGVFTAQSSIDLTLSKLMIYGITLDIGIEAIVIAAALSQPKTIFRIAHPLIHKDPDEYNAIVRQTFLASLLLDDGNYSEALVMLRLFIIWQHLSEDEQRAMMTKYGLVSARVCHFISTVKHLVRRCGDANPRVRNTLNLEEFLKRSYNYEDPSRDQKVGNYGADDAIEDLKDEGYEPELSTRSSPSHTKKNDHNNNNIKKRRNGKWRSGQGEMLEVKLEDYVNRVVLSEEVIMKIRLILSWTFHHNLLMTNHKSMGRDKGFEDVEYAHCLEMKEDHTIPIKDVIKYFPEPHCDISDEIRLLLSGKYHYELDLRSGLPDLGSVTATVLTVRAVHSLLVERMMMLWSRAQFEERNEDEENDIMGDRESILPATESSKGAKEKKSDKKKKKNNNNNKGSKSEEKKEDEEEKEKIKTNKGSANTNIALNIK